ncbi:MAG: YetF domain-containing protein [Bryobacteraceae bacterium]
MEQLFGGLPQLGWVAVKALLLFLTAVFGFRVGERRTLAEMSAFDFVAAVAVGAVVGRVPNADTTSYISGAITLITVLVAHRAVSKLRQYSKVAAIFDHPPRVLLSQGEIVKAELRRAGLTEDDLYGLLREHGVLNLREIHLVIFEQRGKISVIRKADVGKGEAELIRDIY